MTLRPWKRRAAECLLSAEPWVQVFRETVELPGGRVIDDFYRVVLPDFAAVVALTDDGQLVMVRGYKHGVGRVVLSVPAGLVDADETPLHAAQRELREETGYAAGEWEGLGSFVVDGNRQCGTMHVFRATGARPVTAPRRDDAEELEVEVMPVARVRDAIRRGDIPHLATASAVALALMANDG